MNEIEFTIIEIAPDQFVFYTENNEWSTDLYPDGEGIWLTAEEAEQEALEYGKFDVLYSDSYGNLDEEDSDFYSQGNNDFVNNENDDYWAY